MKKKVCVVSGSRAEFGLLYPLLKKLQQDDFFDLDFVVTASHLKEGSEGTVDEIEKSGIKITNRIPVKNINDNSQRGIALQISEIIASFTDYFSKNRPDLFIAIGDRYEIFAAAISASTLLIPIAHLFSGSTTSGAIDEIYRHSITKMAVLKFAGCEAYRKRTIQLGEHPDTVFNVGSFGIENVLNTELLSEAEFKKQLNIPLDKKYCTVTFHPATLEGEAFEEELYELIGAMDEFSGYYYVITLSNADHGGSRINEIWRSEAQKRANFIVVPSLGLKKYLSSLKYSEMMIGNSSSGITEGPAMKIPVVNIGDRQKGRILAQNIISCDTKKENIIKAFEKARSEEFKKLTSQVKNPFGDGKTSSHIIKILKEALKNPLSVKKDFYDINQ